MLPTATARSPVTLYGAYGLASRKPLSHLHRRKCAATFKPRRFCHHIASYAAITSVASEKPTALPSALLPPLPPSQNPPHQKTPESQEFYFSSLVPETGLEPAHLMAYAPKAYVYTNFTTRAYLNYNTKKPRTLVSAFLRVNYSKTPWRFFITRVVM